MFLLKGVRNTLTELVFTYRKCKYYFTLSICTQVPTYIIQHTLNRIIYDRLVKLHQQVTDLQRGDWYLFLVTLHHSALMLFILYAMFMCVNRQCECVTRTYSLLLGKVLDSKEKDRYCEKPI